MRKHPFVIVLLVATLLIPATILLRQTGLLSSGPAADDHFAVPEGVLLDVGGMPSLGSPDAAIALVEFADYECPYCQAHARTVFPDLKKTLIEAGTLRYVFANYPLAGIHANAVPMAMAAICAGKQGKFWEMHDHLFEALLPARATERQLLGLTHEVTLDRTVFDECYDGAEASERIAADMEQGALLEIKSIPTFVIGRTAPNGRVVPKAIFAGSKAVTAFEDVIRQVLAIQE